MPRQPCQYKCLGKLEEETGECREGRHIKNQESRVEGRHPRIRGCRSKLSDRRRSPKAGPPADQGQAWLPEGGRLPAPNFLRD